MVKHCVTCAASDMPHAQDQMYGLGMRVHTQAAGGKRGSSQGELRCTVCTPPKVRAAPAPIKGKK